jgi:hypothetical protein
MPVATLFSLQPTTLSSLINGLPLLALSITLTYGLWMLPQLQTLIAAEGGRKKDLVRRSHVQGFDFDVLILIPFTLEAQYPALVDCLACLTAQQYPQHKVKWAILAHTAVQHYQSTVEALVPANTSSLMWLNAPETETATSLLAWGVRHALSHFPAQLVGFLHPSDLVKPDFLNQLTAKAYSHEVIQGYVASRDYAGGWLHKLIGIETRISSRIQAAGRYHAGMPLILRESGFAIKTTLLEQLPWPAIGEPHASWLYSLALAQYRIPIVWAPTVVVYKRLSPSWGESIEIGWKETMIKLGLGVQSMGLLFQKPPQSLVTAITLTSYWWTTSWVFALAVASSFFYIGVQLNQPATQISGIVLGSMVVGVQLATLGVSRLPWQDWLVFALLKPVFAVISVVALPLMLLKTIVQLALRVSKTRLPAQPNRQTAVPAPTRSVQSLAENTTKRPPVEAVTTTAIKAPAVEPLLQEEVSSQNKLAPTTTNQSTEFLDALWQKAVAAKAVTLQATYTVPLLFGTKSVEATVEVTVAPNKGIQLTLQYKQQAFKTAFYPLFSQGFYELQEKLSQYNIQLLSCGSCAYYFQPALAVTQQQQVGLCLKQVEQHRQDEETPLLSPITVLSNHCTHHTPFSERAAILASLNNQQAAQEV